MLLLKFADNAYAFAIWIASGIYKIASYAFEVFIILATGRIVDGNIYQTIINNFYIVLGIILLFFLAFSLLKGMVNPEDQKQGTSSIKKIVINLVTSMAIMAILPTIFGFLYDFQTSFITRYNVIGRFFGYGSLSGTSENIDSSNTVEVERGAYQITNGVFTAFLNVNVDYCKNNSTIDDNGYVVINDCQAKIYNKEWLRMPGELSFASAISEVERTGDFNLYNEFSANITDGELDFQWFLAIIAGLILVYVAVSFCFDMGLRMVKLVFYQVIAPIPIFGRVIPEGPLKDSFGKWLKLVLTCYLEVYVRIFVFYFALWLCVTLLGSSYLDDLNGFSPFIILFAKAFLVMGIVMFMKQAPKFISDVTGLDSGNMKLGIRDKLKEGGFFTAGAAVGALGAGITGSVRNATNAYGNIKNKWASSSSEKRASMVAGGILSTIAGGTSALTRSLKGGWKSQSFADIKKATTKGVNDSVAARDKRAAYIASHGGNVDTGNVIQDFIQGNVNVAKGRLKDAKYVVKSWAGYDNLSSLRQQKSNYDRMTSLMSQLKGLAEGEAEVKAYAGQLKALSENPIKREDFEQEITDLVTGQKKKVFDDKAFAKAQHEHAEKYKAAEDRYKLAISKAIVDNRNKGNYQSIMEQFNTFRKEHMDDAIIASMQEITPDSLLAQWQSINGDAILTTGSDKDASQLWKQMKGDPSTGTFGIFGWSAIDTLAKTASGDTSVKISKIEAEEKAKEEK